MKRFQMERALMLRRWHRERLNHGGDFGDCHCGKGMGTMRKHRPNESHPSSSCRACAYDRYYWKMESRRARYAKRAVLIEELADAP